MTSLISTVLLVSLLSTGVAAKPVEEPASTTANKVWPKSLVERIRDLLNLQPVEAVGGSRSSQTSAVCLVSPVTTQDGGNGIVWVGLSDPMLVSGTPLNEIVIERDGIPIWSQLASSHSPITDPIAWPLEPLTPRESVTLKLRPLNAGGFDFVEVKLVGGDAGVMISSKELANSLGEQARDPLKAVEKAAQSGQKERLAQLMSSPLVWTMEGVKQWEKSCR